MDEKEYARHLVQSVDDLMSVISNVQSPGTWAVAICQSDVLKLRKALMCSERTCCEPENTFANTNNCCCVDDGGGSRIVVSSG